MREECNAGGEAIEILNRRPDPERGILESDLRQVGNCDRFWSILGTALLVMGFFPPTAKAGGGEQVLLKLKDGTEVEISHSETREEVLTGKVGAISVQFSREKIAAFRVPVAEKALSEAQSLLDSLDSASFDGLDSLEDRLSASAKQLKDCETRLKWLVPEIAGPVPELEYALQRIREILERSSQAEKEISYLSDLSESTEEQAEAWRQALSKLEALSVEIPFPEKQEELKRRVDSVVAKRELFLKRGNEPFFKRLSEIHPERLTRDDYRKLEDLSKGIQDSRLQHEAAASLDRLRLKIPAVIANATAESEGSHKQTPSNQEAAIAKIPPDRERPVGSTLRRIDPKLIGIGIAACILIFVVPGWIGKKQRERPKNPGKITGVSSPISTAPRDSTEVVAHTISISPEEPPVAVFTASDAMGAESPQERTPGLNSKAVFAQEEEEEWTEPVSSNPFDSSPLPEQPNRCLESDEITEVFAESEEPDWMKSEEEISIPYAEQSACLEPHVDLDAVLNPSSDDPFGLNDALEDSWDPNTKETSPPTSPETKGRRDRLMMEDLFDALEKTLEVRLNPVNGVEENPRPPQTGTAFHDDLEEPKVSLGGILGFEQDISQFLEETPPNGSCKSIEEVKHEPRFPVEPEDVSIPLESQVISPEFRFLVGSGYPEPESSIPCRTESIEVPQEQAQSELKEPLLPSDVASALSESLPFDDDSDTKSGTSAIEPTQVAPPDNVESPDDEIICPLTGVFTRFFFDQQFPKAFLRSRRDRYPLTLLLMKIDPFENGLTGELKEDRELILTSVANSLRRSVRTRDILARYEENSFAILMIQVKPTSAFPLALKIRNDLKKINLISSTGDPMDLTVSFGMNCVLEDDRQSSQEDLMEGCLVSLAEASAKGGNQILWHGVEGDSAL